MNITNKFGNKYFLPLPYGAQSRKGLILVRCGTRNMFGLSDDILPQGGRPTFISIAQHKACIFGSIIKKNHTQINKGNNIGIEDIFKRSFFFFKRTKKIFFVPICLHYISVGLHCVKM